MSTVATPLSWADHGVAPPRRLPTDALQAAAYLAEALGHPVYERWTWRRLMQVYGALPDARRAKPRVCAILVDAPEAVEAWQRGRLLVATVAAAPSVDVVIAALLKAHRQRFKPSPAVATVTDLAPGALAADQVPALLPSDAGFPASLTVWLQRTGRLHNAQRDTNTLGALDDHAALASFLRERATRSRHTWRAYSAELQRLVQWCLAQDRGPLSDLTRLDLQAYQGWLRRGDAPMAAGSPLSERSQQRALAVVTSLFGYWHATGYLRANPAAQLGGGARSRAGIAPQRFVPAELLRCCDDWVARHLASDGGLRSQRLGAIWTLYRLSGARLAELAWNRTAALPRLAVDGRGDWTLTVLGKGDKERAIPLPRAVDGVLRGYRLARGLPQLPHALERIPLIHGDKGGWLGERGLYDQVKAILLAVASEHDAENPAGAAVLRAASPHWLRHAYARTLVVDRRVPLPAAQALLGHASVQTTAAYAKTDLSQLREFVEAGFGREACRRPT